MIKNPPMAPASMWYGSTDTDDKTGTATFGTMSLKLESFNDYFSLSKLIEAEYNRGVKQGKKMAYDAVRRVVEVD